MYKVYRSHNDDFPHLPSVRDILRMCMAINTN